MTYRLINPELSRHPVYDNSSVPEYARISFSRLRLSSHYLRIETGRWSRIPKENRVCVCDSSSVQDETHVLLHCPLTKPVRDNFRDLEIDQCYSLKELFVKKNEVRVVLFCHKVLEIFNKK